MRIKLWESFEYYQKIDSVDYDNMISFNPKYIDKLKSLILEVKTLDNKKFVNIHFYDVKYSIIELEDGWFIVTVFYSGYVKYRYRCDQFDGVLRLLKDKGVI